MLNKKNNIMAKDFKILLTGDIFIKNETISVLSDEMKEVLKEHAFTVCDFEGTLETADSKPISKAGPNVCQHLGAANVLKKDGFNLFNLANNHIMDYGEKALENTINTIGENLVFGAGTSFNEAYKPRFVETNNTKIGFLSYGEAEFGALTNENNEQAGYAWVNHHNVNSIISETKKQCDILIILVHAGIEQIDYPLPEWRQRYYELIDAGADAVIGCHVHVPQGWELYNEKPIFYSMGNFYFDMDVKHPLWNKGYTVSLKIENKELNGFDIIPTEKKDGKVFINKSNDYQQHLEKITAALSDSSYSEVMDKICLELWDKRYKKYYIEAMGWTYFKFGWKDILAVIKNKLLGKDFPLKPTFTFDPAYILHNIKSETHRWAVIRALEILNNKR